MGPAFYVLAILGCGEGEAACQQVGVEQTRFESEAQCNRATGDAVLRNSDIAFPVVVAQCRRADRPLSGSISPRDIELPQPRGRSGQPATRVAARSPR